MSGKKEKLVILPALNEGRFIKSIIEKLKTATDAYILIIDDGSSDDTVFKAEKAGADFIISHSENSGYGRSLVRGFEFALSKNYCKVVTMDCDAQHEPEMVETFFAKLKDADIVSGSRYMGGSEKKTDTPADRYRINRIITRRINKITGYNLSDAFCGFKAYRGSALKKLNVTENGYGMPLQLWIQASRVSLRVKEIPVALIYHTRRSFPEDLNNSSERLKYYMRVIDNEKKRK